MARVWLASYPKCGNTWLRLLLANLGQDESVSRGAPRLAGGIASGRALIDEALMFATGLLTHDECDRIRPAVYRHVSELEDEAEAVHFADTRFLKTHDAWTLTDRNEPLLGGAEAARAAVLIVRDPRDVVASLANHNGKSIDDAVAIMADPLDMLAGATDRQALQLRQRLLGWSGFNRSWLDQRELPVHLLRYEDMLADTAGELSRLLDKLGFEIGRDAIGRAVERSSFEALQAQEAQFGFREAPVKMSEGRFFRKGRAGGWREELTAAQCARIEADHAGMMRRLGYLPESG